VATGGGRVEVGTVGTVRASNTDGAGVGTVRAWNASGVVQDLAGSLELGEPGPVQVSRAAVRVEQAAPG
jgi:hypothetical protein